MSVPENIAATYCICMEDIKSRIAIVRPVFEGRLSTGKELFDYEFVSVQLRKSLELIAFASMTANKDLYANQYAKFAKHWRVKTMLDSLRKLHPSFYPQPIELDHVKDNGSKHFEHVKAGYLTQEDFVTLYDLCSGCIHTWNPFTKKERHIDFVHPISEWVSRIEGLLKLHLMQFVDRDEIWVVEMENANDGRVHAFKAS